MRGMAIKVTAVVTFQLRASTLNFLGIQNQSLIMVVWHLLSLDKKLIQDDAQSKASPYCHRKISFTFYFWMFRIYKANNVPATLIKLLARIEYVDAYLTLGHV